MKGDDGSSSPGSTARGPYRSFLPFRWARGDLPAPTTADKAIVGTESSTLPGGSGVGVAPRLHLAVVGARRAPIDAPAAAQVCHVCKHALQAWPAGSVPPHTDFLVSHLHAAAPGGSGLCISCASSSGGSPAGSIAAGHGFAGVVPPPAALPASARGAQEQLTQHSGGAAAAGASPAAQAPRAQGQGVQMFFIQGFVLRDLVLLLDRMYQLGPLHSWRSPIRKRFLPYQGRCWSRRALAAGAVDGFDEGNWPAGSVMCNMRGTIAPLTGCVWDQLTMMDAEPCEEHTNMPPDGDVVEQEHAFMLQLREPV